MKNCYPLNLNFFPLVDGFVYPTPEETRTTYYPYGIESASSELRQWMQENRLRLDLILLFVHPVRERTSKSVHVDARFGKNFVRQYSINWNYGSNDILMEWWKCDAIGYHNEGQHLHPYTSFVESDCIKIEESTHTGPVLFRNSVPHSVTNTGNIPRYGISVRFKNNYSWEIITKYLEKYLKED